MTVKLKRAIAGLLLRIIAQVYCNGLNLNDEIVNAGFVKGYFEFCLKSEFSHELWAQQLGC